MAHLTHLTEDQIADCLCGLDSPESSAHLAQCADCRTQIEAFVGATAALRSTSAAWSERRSAAMPVPAPSHWGWSAWQPAATWATAAFVLAAVLTPFAVRYQQHDVREVAVTVTGPAMVQSGSGSSASDIERDNAMLAEIDSALSQTSLAPQKAYSAKSDRDDTTGARPVSGSGVGN